MALSLKAELEVWAAALTAYDEQDFIKSLELFSRIADSSKILTNMGLIYATIGEHEVAVEHFSAATNLDQFLAVAYVDVSHCCYPWLMHILSTGIFSAARSHLRRPPSRNYEQLGLTFKLFSAEVLFNRGLSQLYLGYTREGMNDLEQAGKEKVTTEHDVIDDAIRDRGERYTVFSIPVGVLYRPPENKLKNSKVKDYLGKAKLVAASDVNDIYTEFSGVTKLKRSSDPSKNSSLESTSNTEPKGDPPGTLNRSVTAPTPRTTFVEPSPSLQRSKTVNDVPRTQTRDRDKGTDDGRGRARAPRGGSVAPLQILKTPSTTSRSSPVLPHQARTPGSDAQLQSQQPQHSPQSQPPLPTSQPFQQPPRPPSRPTPPNSGHHLAGRRSQSVTHVSIPNTNAMVNGNGTGANLVRHNTSSGVVRRNDAGVARQRVLTDGAGEQPTPVSARFAAFYDDYVGAYVGDSSPQAYDGNGSAKRSPRFPSGQGAHQRGMPGYHSNGYGPVDDFSGGVGVWSKDGHSGVADVPEDISTIRVKLHYQGDVRGMTLSASTTLPTLSMRVAAKFGSAPEALKLKFVDEDGVKISLRDEEDWGLAIETAMSAGRSGGTSRGGGRAVEGRLEVWCEDL
ncbi:NADPH oxidase regulator NoxR [Pisolithus albus]|nr:NADPH oxidase regulator NoxR [Pisolithus albus]